MKNEGMSMNAIATTLPEPTTREAALARIWEVLDRKKEFETAVDMMLGKILIEAKDSLPHGEFLLMIEQDLPFSARRAQQLMAIARNSTITDTKTSSHLPVATDAKYELSRLPEAELREAIDQGHVSPGMTVKEARAIVGHPREPTFVAPRAPEELRRPIINRFELLATMKGYRAAAGQSQLEADFSAGWPEGYTGKLEIDTRRAINDSWWEWMGSRLLVMLLVPAVDACKPDRCPCCGQITP